MARWVKNIAYGSCLCPAKGCDLRAPVFKFRVRSDDPSRRRMGGKLYGECPKHGRFIDQEWLLEHVEWSDQNASEGAPESAPVVSPVAPVKPSEKAAPSPATPPVKKARAPVTAPVKTTSSEEGWFL